jgi:hypothetical protein
MAQAQDAPAANSGAAPAVIAHPEAKLLSRHPDIAQRPGSRLDVTLAAGDYLRFEDTCPGTSEDSKCHTYELVNYAPARNLAVLEIGFYEWHRALLIDTESGRQFEAEDLPYVSADGRFLAIVQADEISTTFNVQIIRHDRAGFFLVADKLDTEPCQFKEWRSDAAFAMICRDTAGNYREKLVTPQGDETWRVSLTGRVAPQQELEMLSKQAYESE